MIFETLQHLKALSLEHLEFNAGKEPGEDRYHVGFIAGINAVLNVELADIQEDIDNNDS